MNRLRAERPELFSFLGVFGSTLLCFLSIGAVLPVLPLYVKGPIGGSDIAVGIVMGAFAITALVGRPVGGRLADLRGRKFVHGAGLAICVVSGLLLYLPSVVGLLISRLVVGLGDGWVFTAGVTWIVDLSPEDRRGQAIGIFGLSIWGGLTAGALIGEGIFRLAGYDAVWAFAAAAPLAGLLVSRLVPEGTAHRQPTAEEIADAELGSAVTEAPQVAAFATPAVGGRVGRWVPSEAIRPGLALALVNMGYATMASFIVLLLDWREIGHGAAAFTVFTGSLVLARLALSRLPDRIGPGRTVLGAGIVEGVGLIAVGLAQSLPAVLAAAALTGVGMSLLFPSLAVLVVNRVPPERRGAAMGAFTAFFDLGYGVGAPVAGVIVSLGVGDHYPAAFVTGGLLCLLGALLGWSTTRTTPRAAPGTAAA